jgi:hypothetical protein
MFRLMFERLLMLKALPHHPILGLGLDYQRLLLLAHQQSFEQVERLEQLELLFAEQLQLEE